MLGVNEDWFKSGKKIITLNDFPATSSELDVTLLDMKLSKVKLFFEEKAWLLVKKRSNFYQMLLLYLLLILSLINIFYLGGFYQLSFFLWVSETRLLILLLLSTLKKLIFAMLIFVDFRGFFWHIRQKSYSPICKIKPIWLFT